MEKAEIEQLIRELIERTTVQLTDISVKEESPKSTWISIEVAKPNFFIERAGEGLHALNHLVHRILESKMVQTSDAPGEGMGILIDINGYQKKHVENIRAIAHMMSERARYFKSNVEVD